MNNILKIVLIVFGVVIVAGGLLFAGALFGASQNGFWNMPMTFASGPSAGVNRGWNGQSNDGFGPMAGSGRGYGFGRGPMMGAGSYIQPAQPLTIEEARQAAQAYVDNLGINGLELGEVMVFDNNAYVVVTEASAGLGAFELLVDPVSKSAYPEYGPNMMWNLKYGGLNHDQMMGGGYGMGMMNGYEWNYSNGTPTDVSADMPVTVEQAVEDAQAYLDQYLAGATAATDPTQFYGYYTVDFSKDGKVAGMLSINGYSGQVFLHTWHGIFIEETE